MLERYALLFSDLTIALTYQEAWWGNTTLGTNPGPMAKDSEVDAVVRRHRLEGTLQCLEHLRVACENTGMSQVIPEVARIDTDLRSHAKRGFSVLSDPRDRLKHLRERLRDELESEYFLHVSRADRQFYGQPEGFGSEVAAKFPTGTEDVEGAGNCLALGQPTASVFHLMRLVELGVRALAKKLKVKSIDPDMENWNTITDHIDKAIRSLPAKTKANKLRKVALAGVSGHLNVVRISTRNEVMHPKKTYTQEEARDLFQATRLFMHHLAGLI